jgi:hypothetical protein
MNKVIHSLLMCFLISAVILTACQKKRSPDTSQVNTLEFARTEIGKPLQEFRYTMLPTENILSALEDNDELSYMLIDYADTFRVYSTQIPEGLQNEPSANENYSLNLQRIQFQ